MPKSNYSSDMAYNKSKGSSHNDDYDENGNYSKMKYRESMGNDVRSAYSSHEKMGSGQGGAKTPNPKVMSSKGKKSSTGTASIGGGM